MAPLTTEVGKSVQLQQMADLAISEINAEATFFPQNDVLERRPTVYDSDKDTTGAQNTANVNAAVADFASASKPITAFLGIRLTPGTIPPGFAALNIPAISAYTSDYRMGDATTYPFFFSMVTHDYTVVRAMVEYLLQGPAPNLDAALVYDSGDTYGMALATEVLAQKAAAVTKFSLTAAYVDWTAYAVTASFTVANVQTLIQQMKGKGQRTIILLCSTTTFANVATALFNEKTYGYGHMIVTLGAFFRPAYITNESVLSVLQQALIFGTGTGNPLSFTQVKVLETLRSQQGLAPTAVVLQEAVQVYDAVYALARAIKAQNAACGIRVTGPQIMTQLRSVTFTGAGGGFSFPASGAYRNNRVGSFVLLQNVRNLSTVSVASMDDTTFAYVDFKQGGKKTIVFPGTLVVEPTLRNYRLNARMLPSADLSLAVAQMAADDANTMGVIGDGDFLYVDANPSFEPTKASGINSVAQETTAAIAVSTTGTQLTKWAALLGPPSDPAITTSAAAVNACACLPTLEYSGANIGLSDAGQYPYVLLQHVTGLMRYMSSMAYVRHFKWTEFCLVASGPPFKELKAIFDAHAPSLGLVNIFSVDVGLDAATGNADPLAAAKYETMLLALQSRACRVVVFTLPSAYMVDVAEVAVTKLKTNKSVFTWILTDGTLTTGELQAKTGVASGYLDGSFGVGLSLTAQVTAAFRKKLTDKGLTLPSSFNDATAIFLYETVLLAAHGIAEAKRRALADLKVSNYLATMQQVGFQQDVKKLMEALRAVTFTTPFIGTTTHSTVSNERATLSNPFSLYAIVGSSSVLSARCASGPSWATTTILVPTFNNGVSVAPVVCNLASVFDAASKQCVPCLSGTYLPQVGAQCTKCPADAFCPLATSAPTASSAIWVTNTALVTEELPLQVGQSKPPIFTNSYMAAYYGSIAFAIIAWGVATVNLLFGYYGGSHSKLWLKKIDLYSLNHEREEGKANLKKSTPQGGYLTGIFILLGCFGIAVLTHSYNEDKKWLAQSSDISFDMVVPPAPLTIRVALPNSGLRQTSCLEACVAMQTEKTQGVQLEPIRGTFTCAFEVASNTCKAEFVLARDETLPLYSSVRFVFPNARPYAVQWEVVGSVYQGKEYKLYNVEKAPTIDHVLFGLTNNTGMARQLRSLVLQGWDLFADDAYLHDFYPQAASGFTVSLLAAPKLASVDKDHYASTSANTGVQLSFDMERSTSTQNWRFVEKKSVLQLIVQIQSLIFGVLFAMLGALVPYADRLADKIKYGDEASASVEATTNEALSEEIFRDPFVSTPEIYPEAQELTTVEEVDTALRFFRPHVKSHFEALTLHLKAQLSSMSPVYKRIFNDIAASVAVTVRSLDTQLNFIDKDLKAREYLFLAKDENDDTESTSDRW